MKKVALVFVVAVLLPSLVLAWLAVRSLRDQQFLLERQQSLLCQRVTDTLAADIAGRLAEQQQDFGFRVEDLVAGKDARDVAARFDELLRQSWPLAEVGFCVTVSGKILSPSLNARNEATAFFSDNGRFLGNREPAEVYRSVPTANNNNGQNFARNSADQSYSPNSISSGSFGGGNNAGVVRKQSQTTLALANPAAAPSPDNMELDRSAAKTVPADKLQAGRPAALAMNSPAAQPQAQIPASAKAQTRAVSPQSASYQQVLKDSADEDKNNLSKVIPAEAEFSQLIGNESDGILARFLQNKLKIMFWHRLNREPDLIFGAQLNLGRVVDGLRGLVQPEPSLRDEICLALLDDNAKPVVISRAGFQTNWKRPFVATEIGEALPHWEVAAYLVNPARLTEAAHTAKLTLGLLIALLVLAIGIGSWLIVSSLNSELKLARQKTDFVSNVSHELKTPLTSIRMFSELLAEGRVTDQAKQHSYLNIITAEAARLTRLINNVLDFSRLETGEKKYNFQPCDLVEVVRLAAQTFRPHLEAAGFQFDCALPDTAISVRGDADALSQIIVNLLSNAEKYSNNPVLTPSPRPNGERAGARGSEFGHLTPALSSIGGGEGGLQRGITLQLARRESPLPHAEVRVLDRGLGVPRGSGEKIFEKFYRAHDSLSSGVQGSGLGLTIARQIARAHGGDVVYEPREGGGSCFILRIPCSGAL